MRGALCVARLTCLLLALVSWPAAAKVIQSIAQLDSHNTELNIAKFSYGVDKDPGSMAGFFWPDPNTHSPEIYDAEEVHLYLYDDEAWAAYQKLEAEGSLCQDRVKLAKWNHPVRFSKDGFHKEIEASARTRVWYLILADCRLEFYDAHPPAIMYNVTMLNCGGNCGDAHLPADEHGLFTIHLLLLGLLVAYMAFYAKLLISQKKTLGQVHLVAVMLGIASIFQAASVFFEFCHLWVYRSNGKGLRFRHTFFAADLLSEVCQGLSELVITIILVAIASGWTLTNDIDIMGNSVSEGSDAAGGMLSTLRTPGALLKKVTPANVCILLICLAQIVLEVMGRGYDEDFSSFHDHEHTPGYILMAMRICMCLVFHKGIMGTKVGASDAVKQFLLELQITGTIWFVSFPVLVFLSSLFAPYLRHRVVTGGSIASQVSALAYM